MGLQEANIHQLLKVRSEIDEEIRRHKEELTILFTDVVGSTTYFDRFGDTAGLLLIQRHDDLVAGAVHEFQGVVIKTIGDSVMAEFPKPLLAVRAAVEIQRRVFRHNQSLLESQRLQLRAGINCGVGFRRGTDFLGDAVNVAARITKRSGPAQILISKSVQDAIGTDICCRPLGSATLPGKSDAEELFEVIWTDADIYDGIRSAINAIWVSANMSRQDDFILNTPYPADAEADPLPPAPARYEILSRIGVGGMGVVFKARDRETGEIIALKVLKPEIADQPSVMENLKNELRLARRITHKNVCRIYDFSRTDGIASISMEFVQGESLRQVLDRFGAFTTRRAIKLAEQICDGLSEAHAQGIVHRDIKPENFMVDECGNVKLMDFGVAHLLRDGSTRAVGTPSYMAPEQAQALPYDQRADIYALGLVLFEMFTGSVAFAGDTPIAVALQQMVEAPRNPRDVEHTVPEHIERAILRCLEKDPEKRFSSVKELKAALVADAATAQQSVPAWRSFSRIHVVDPIKALAGNRRGLLTTVGLVVVLTALFTAGIAFDRTTKNTEELASFQNAQSVDTEAAWNEFLKNHREGQLSVAAQERLNKLRIRAQERSRAAAAATLPASAVTTPPPAPVAETTPAPAAPITGLSAPATKQRPNWTTLFDTVPIRGGIFMMGKEDGKKDEKPRHHVRVDGFQMSRTEITNRQYMTFLKETGHPPPKDPSFAKNYLAEYPNRPVVNVSYKDALDFCKWASAKFGVTVRLPTEAEWEYAALGGKKDALYPWGSESPNSRARYKQNLSGPVHTVERTSFPPNGYGLYNMSGNVNEWVSDFYSKDYYSVSPAANPAGPDRGTKRVIRGGSWADDETRLWLARRASRDPQDRSDQLGFRIVVKSPLPSARTQQASISEPAR